MKNIKALKIKAILIAWVILLINGCKEDVKTAEEYLKWMNQPESGLVIEKKIADKKITVKYLTPEYLTYNELKDKETYSEKTKDSIFNWYSSSRTFLMTIRPADENGESVQMEGITSMSEYTERTKTLNFDMGEYLRLITEKAEFIPVLTSMENTYDLQKYRNIYVVYSEKDSAEDLFSSKKIDFVFNDELFSTGISHFVFDKEKIDIKNNLIFLSN